MFIEFVGHAELLRVHKVIQGAVNKLCYSGAPGFSVVLHPDASEVRFDLWPTDLPVDFQGGIRIGGAIPAVIVSESLDSELMARLRAHLRLTVDLPAQALASRTRH